VSGHSFRLAAYDFSINPPKFARQEAGSKAVPDPGTVDPY